MKAIYLLKSVQSRFRSVLFLLIILLGSSIASADVLKVDTIIHDPFDLTAAINSKLDRNGNPCALLKIVLPKEASNIIFEGNTIDIQNDEVEVYVYMSPGSKYLTIKSAGFEPLHIYFPDKGILALEGKQTYKMKVVRMKTLSQVKKTSNGAALAYSIIPGVGLIQKGHTGEGVTFLIGDVALLGAGIVFFSSASSQKKIMKDVNTGIEEYNKAKSKYDSSKNAGYVCFGVAGAVYIINLIRSYVATPKPNARINWNITPERSAIPNVKGYGLSMGVNLSFCYTF